MTVDNFYDLTYYNVGGRGSILSNGSLESLKQMRNINLEVLKRLIDDVNSIIGGINDDETRRTLSIKVKLLMYAYSASERFDPDKFYEEINNGRRGLDSLGWHNCGIRDFEKVIDFLNGVYECYLYCELNNDLQSDQVFGIVNLVKKACIKLGITSISAEDFYNILMNPDLNPPSTFFKYEINIDYENTLPGYGIVINSLPYVIHFPSFRSDGTIIKYDALPIKVGTIWYNKKDYNRIVEANQRAYNKID